MLELPPGNPIPIRQSKASVTYTFWQLDETGRDCGFRCLRHIREHRKLLPILSIDINQLNAGKEYMMSLLLALEAIELPEGIFCW